MPDMLVKLYELPSAEGPIAELAAKGIVIRRALAAERHIVTAWAVKHFGPGWADECAVAIAHQPVGCFIAQKDKTMLGFACYNATCKAFFGPTGVDPASRGLGIGRALLLRCLHAMHEEGYAYGVIGAAGPTEFYATTVGAIPIEGSSPGIYRGMIYD